MTSPPISRRVLLAVAGAAALAAGGCRGVQWHPTPITPDESALRAAITAKERIIARYAATEAAADGGQAELLRELLGRHEEHLGAMLDRLPPRPEEEEEDPALAASLGPEPETPLSPGALSVAERSAAARHARLAAQASDAGLAQLLASISACEAAHAWILEQED